MAVTVKIILASVLLTVAADASPRLPPGITCEQVRALVAQHGKARAAAWAIEQGFTLREINEARKCLRAA